MATLRLPTHAATKVAPKLGLVGLDPAKAAAREAARQAAEVAAAKAEAEARAKAEAEAKQEAERAAEKAAKLAAERAAQREGEARRRAARKAFTALLCERWPDIFNQTAPRPLAMGIDKQITAAIVGVPTKVRGRALHRWTHQPRYLAALAEGGPRYNLDGTEAGTVTPEQQAYVRALLAQRDAEAPPRDGRRRERSESVARAA